MASSEGINRAPWITMISSLKLKHRGKLSVAMSVIKDPGTGISWLMGWGDI